MQYGVKGHKYQHELEFRYIIILLLNLVLLTNINNLLQNIYIGLYNAIWGQRSQKSIEIKTLLYRHIRVF